MRNRPSSANPARRWQFYRALNSRDRALRAENWEQSADIAMDNPLGGIKRGWSEIREVYERIFRDPARLWRGERYPPEAATPGPP
jgi:hypothetical protein